jgi:hypothetical protein
LAGAANQRPRQAADRVALPPASAAGGDEPTAPHAQRMGLNFALLAVPTFCELWRRCAARTLAVALAELAEALAACGALRGPTAVEIVKDRLPLRLEAQS